MYNLIKKNKKIIVITFLIIFFFLAYLMKTNKIYNFDQIIYDYIFPKINDYNTNYYKIITSLAGAFVVILLTLLALIIFKKKTYGKLIALNLINVVILNQILKFLFQRQRPNIFVLVDETGYSFPSAHAMVSLAFYGFIIYLILKTNIKRNLKILLSLLFILVIILICISRIYLGVHYASDVIAGLCISSAYLIIYIDIIKKHIKINNNML
ncbi:MAG: phosphatase PAP2 family protein [Bacilli bacterium]|nr:phosphatase PAP2 family protein [Bacilli bacterium]